MATQPVAAQSEARISELSLLDHQYMEQQRTLLEDITRRHFGRGFSGDTDSDLQLLQSLLDQRLVKPSQTRELQAMGMILGDLLAAELKLHWVIYEDKLGRSRALRDGNTDNFLFPMTMISRRQEAGSNTAVAVIYRKAYDIMAATQTKLPFQ
ncbi:DUF3806 domain-containing protein [Parahaliea sp. F7430]|uniref:DUF3806 domain-containing protein n=2 Tax=Sediminihaliea albiluteola TaxID=2758564 RepID=A0A7W2TVK9_9GAMM|nr:DUF3806 domain-containing protein [Sediminihaliea albiluteola]